MKKKKYKYEDIYIRFDVGYSVEGDRSSWDYITVIAKTIDKAIEKARKQLKDIQVEKPIITEVQFSDFVNSKDQELYYDNNDEVWYREIDWEEECKKKAEEKLEKEKRKPLDTSCWYINPFDINKRVFNQNGEIVELNTEQSRSDYAFFNELHLTQDNTKTELGVTRYKSVCPMIYECIVYGHNFRYGYIQQYGQTTSLTEAITIVRIHYTKLLPDDDPRREDNVK